MNEVIASILDAEKRAEDIVKTASAKARDIKRDADEKGEKIKNSAVAVFKVHRSATVKDAENKADGVYAEIVENGKRVAEELKSVSSSKTDTIAEEIAKSIIDN